MTSTELDRLVQVGQLKREPPGSGEVEGLRRSGRARLEDAHNPALSLESRFDLAYNAAHALALAALRRKGYRPGNRYIVFQVLPHTLGLSPGVWRTLTKAHDVRNVAEYEGAIEVDKRLVEDLAAAATVVRQALDEMR